MGLEIDEVPWELIQAGRCGTGLSEFALRKLTQWSVKKWRLSERSEFRHFSGTESIARDEAISKLSSALDFLVLFYQEKRTLETIQNGL